MENNNSVCFIAKINKLRPIGGADKIEYAQINGWGSIVQKNIHKEGDLVLCITTDAVIPEELAVKWGVSNYLRKGNRVRTVKLKSVYSECILISIKDCPPGLVKFGNILGGEDMMENFKIYKYEPPAIIVQEKSGRKHKYHQNPNFHIYYKFPNHKNVPNMFNETDIVAITRKIHGSNFRCGFVKKSKLSIWDRIRMFFGNDFAQFEFVYGSHNVEKGSDSQGYYSTDIWKEMIDKYDIKNQLLKYINFNYLKEGIILYGEVYGPGVQGDKYNYNLKSRELAMFDIMWNGEYLDECGRLKIFSELELPMVPLLYEGKWSKEIQDELVGGFIPNTNSPHEGIVVSCVTGNRHKISKVINPDYLIFGEKNNVPDSH